MPGRARGARFLGLAPSLAAVACARVGGPGQRPVPRPRCHHSAVWTGRELIAYGGYDACGSGGHLPFGDGAAYDPAAGEWRRLNPAA